MQGTHMSSTQVPRSAPLCSRPPLPSLPTIFSSGLVLHRQLLKQQQSSKTWFLLVYILQPHPTTTFLGTSTAPAPCFMSERSWLHILLTGQE